MEIATSVTFSSPRPDRAGAVIRSVDLVASVAHTHRVGDLTAALQHALGLPTPVSLRLARAGRVPLASTPLMGLDLCHGDHIWLDPPDAHRPAAESGRIVAVGSGSPTRPHSGDGCRTRSADSGRVLLGDHTPVQFVSVDVIAGPDAGLAVRVDPGVHVVGRGADCGVMLHDPTVSRRHLEVSVGDDSSVVVVPETGTNGLTVNDTPVADPTWIGPTDVVGIGMTRFVVRAVTVEPGRTVGGLGMIDFTRTPYRPPDLRAIEIEPFGPVPERPKPRRIGFATVLLPLVGGIGMYLFTRRAMFLMMTALSPIMAIGSMIEDRRSGRKAFREGVAQFHLDVGERVDVYRDAGIRERQSRSAASPDLAELARRAAHRTANVWIRHRVSPDVGLLRLGTGTSLTRFRVEVSDDGDDELRQRALNAFAGLDQLRAVPIEVDLIDDPIVGVHGLPADTTALVSALLIQVCVLHSPQDILVAAALGPTRSMPWLKWLPHLRPEQRMLPVGHAATDAGSARRLVSALVEFADARIAKSTTSHADGVVPWPRFVVVLDAELDLDAADCEQLFDRGPRAGISVIWVSSHANGVVRNATRIVSLSREHEEPTSGPPNSKTLTGRVWSTNNEMAEKRFFPESLTADCAEAIARDLAPLRDATTSAGSGQIPTVATLFEVLGQEEPDADWVAARWNRSHRAHVNGRIGVGFNGPVEIDLVEQGPHALIGGTSGAGKSELLQSMVAGLAVQHPPHHVNFLFIDYKGGASTQVFQRLPHTVGSVTNLNAPMAMRALTSLRAELNYRMRTLEGRAKDIVELARIDETAPPSLVIIVDEFATLVKEIPDFVAGMVDIAQRGRSLGIHLVLATQRPAGAVNDNILANTNLRIALRTLDRPDSTSIIDTPDAAAIPHSLRGRALMRNGPGSLVEVQAAYSGAPIEVNNAEPVRLGVFDRPDASAQHAPTGVWIDVPGSLDDRTQLDVVIESIVEAHRASGRDEARKPWREPLPERISLDEITSADRPDGHADRPSWCAAVGMADVPEDQSQIPFVVDLAANGGLIVFGSGGSGKTTALCTFAAAVEPHPDGQTPDDHGVVVIGFDGGSRDLAAIADLPWVADVAAADDVEAVTRQICVLEAEIDRRRRLSDQAGEPRVVLLIDDWGPLVTTLEEVSTAATPWADRLQRVIADGRSVGIHSVLTADRLGAINARLQATIGSRLILRHADVSQYIEYGIANDRVKGLDLPPGRGLFGGACLIQIATIGDDPSAFGQRRDLLAMAQRRSVDQVEIPSTLVSSVLPTRVGRRDVRYSQPSAFEPTVVCGLGDVSGAAVGIDLELSHLLIAGPPGSGRSTAIAAVADSAIASGYRVAVLGSDSARLAEFTATKRFGRRGIAACDDSDIAELLSVVQASSVDGGDPVMVLVDDLDRLDDAHGVILAEMFRRVRVVAAVDVRSVSGFTTNPAVAELRRARRTLLLQVEDPAEFMQITGLRYTGRPGVPMPPGRAVLVADRRQTIVQVTDVVTGSNPRRGNPMGPDAHQPPPGAINK